MTLLIIYCIVAFIPNELEAVKLERNWKTKPLDETHVSINVSQPGLPFYQILNKIGEDVYIGSNETLFKLSLENNKVTTTKCTISLSCHPLNTNYSYLAVVPLQQDTHAATAMFNSDSGDILYGGSRAVNTFNKYSVQADLSTGNPIKFELDTVTTGEGFIKEPTFVGRPFEYTHADGNEYVFLLYREVALEYTAGYKVYSRIARVCKNDTGDSMNTYKFVTFIKASLECSVPNGDEPAFQYNYMQDVVWDQSSGKIYAVFTIQENGPPTSALCSYRMEDIMNLFDNGNFLIQSGGSGTNAVWNEGFQLFNPRPGTCQEVHTTDYPPLLHKSVPSYNALERTGGTQVAPPANFPTSDPPIFNVDDVRFTSLAVDFDNYIYYIGTTTGTVMKVLKENCSDPQHETFSVFEVNLGTRNPITGLEFLTNDTSKHLVVTTEENVITLPLNTNCTLGSVEMCLATQSAFDPSTFKW
ncbi:semaphorin-2A-like [Patiria miniata]|uniref:Sema domain-containing protein n=1 Tax=Patiria miniata TaxID=46514 RepID=A0A914BLP5_PATMI|nr:semaphorin-2A-like [Patiria miniata]